MKPDFSSAKNILGCSLILTSEAFPEQYDVYKGKHQIGYLRLRNGKFRANYPRHGGEEIFFHEFDDALKGHFDDDDERTRFLEMVIVILKKRFAEDANS